jgi:hypothetical protein
MFRRGLRVLVLLGVALGALLLQVAPAGAVFRGRPPAPPAGGSNSNTELVLSDTGPGTGVIGFIADPSSTFDPVVDGYPASDPTTGFSPKDEGFAGVIFAHPPGGGGEDSLYCIDINTNTYIGFGYTLGTWDAAKSPTSGMWPGCSTSTTPIPTNPPA